MYSSSDLILQTMSGRYVRFRPKVVIHPKSMNDWLILLADTEKMVTIDIFTPKADVHSLRKTH